MSHVLSLIANPASHDLSADHVELAQRTAGGAVDWLAKGVACDIALRKEADLEAILSQVRQALSEAPIDVNIVPMAGRRKKLLLADMDSTLIGQECIDELGAALGIKDRIAAITERSMRGEMNFEEALRERVALLRGVSRAQIGQIIADKITLNPGARVAVQTMRANGAYTALVSGGFTLFTTVIAAQLGFHENRANTLLFHGDSLSGAVSEPILGREAKLQALNELTAAKHINTMDAVCIGDGANDLAMIQAAGMGIAFRAKPIVAAEASAQINHGDLTGLLYLQGYREAELIA